MTSGRQHARPGRACAPGARLRAPRGGVRLRRLLPGRRRGFHRPLGGSHHRQLGLLPRAGGQLDPRRSGAGLSDPRQPECPPGGGRAALPVGPSFQLAHPHWEFVFQPVCAAYLIDLIEPGRVGRARARWRPRSGGSRVGPGSARRSEGRRPNGLLERPPAPLRSGRAPAPSPTPPTRHCSPTSSCLNIPDGPMRYRRQYATLRPGVPQRSIWWQVVSAALRPLTLACPRRDKMRCAPRAG